MLACRVTVKAHRTPRDPSYLREQEREGFLTFTLAGRLEKKYQGDEMEKSVKDDSHLVRFNDGEKDEKSNGESI
jgi:hypothetical protein